MNRKATYLTNIVQTVEDVLPRLLTLDAGLQFVLLGCLESPERVCAFHVTVKELRRLGCAEN